MIVIQFYTVALIAIVGLATFGYFLMTRRGRRQKNYPPGPWGIPMVGHLLFMVNHAPKKCMEWAQQYGKIFAVDFGTFPTVILSDAELIRAAFNRDAISGRPDFPMFSVRSGGVAEGVLLSSGKKWQEARRFILRTLREFGFGKKSMEDVYQIEVRDLVESFHKSAGKTQSMHNRFNVAVLNALWTLVGGERFDQDNNELRKVINLVTNQGEMNILAGLSNFYPAIAHFAPKLSGFDKIARDSLLAAEFFKKCVEQHRTTWQRGQPRDFIDAYLNEIQNTTNPTSSFYKENGDKSIIFNIFDLFIAGGDTTSGVLEWCFLYLAKYQEIQIKLQGEIDAVVGQIRLPSLSDRKNMPFTEAVIHETMRLASFTPFVCPHSTMQEVEIGGYTIPKNTLIIGNVYAVHHDPKVWGDSEVFRPERFLSQEGNFVPNSAFLGFSVGKRACPGENMAKDQLFLFITSIFQAFTVSPTTSAEDLSIEPNVGLALTPKRHKLVFMARN